MTTHRSTVLAASLGLTVFLSLHSCADTQLRNEASTSNSKLRTATDKLTVHIVEAAKPG